MTVKLGFLISGRGSNLRAVYDNIQRGALDASIEVVISNHPDVPGIQWAQEAGLRTSVMTRADLPERSRRHQAMLAVLESAEVELLVLAGFNEIVDRALVAAYSGRILNIHPSLLPAFGGTMHAVREAWEYGVKITGCTVHFVTMDVDGGPIVLQRAIEVRDVDTAETLAERVLVEEHLALSEAIGLAASGRLKLVGRRVVSV
ncbi:MAG: phosphoribosylglycinamide formyltransferase [Chloroflexi bacterium]|nr:phosphoribosylglycinamide formyltransferase [Chloroflexota bacterium]